MAFNGSGSFARLYNWVSDRNASIKIRADRMDAEMDGIATGLSTCITKDGQTTITQDIPFNNKRITGLADATAATDAVNRQTADARYLTNAGITASVAASALTITLTNASGSAPTAADPVIIPFRSPTASSGAIIRRTVDSSLSLVISSGSTLGTTSAQPFNVYVVAFDDGGTVRLAAIQAASGTDVGKLQSRGIVSATGEGGSGNADSPQVYYASVGITAKAYAMLARLEWNSGLTTAGTWNVAPDKIEMYHPDFLLAGYVVDSVLSQPTTYAGYTAATPVDDTIPQISEGSEIATAVIALKSGASRIRGSVAVTPFSTVAGAVVVLHVHVNAVANAIAAAYCGTPYFANVLTSGSMGFAHTPAATGSQTYRLRAGVSSGGAIYLNGNASTRILGGAARTASLLIEEIMG